ncbi:MAG: alpha-amylase family glycosyl hydrolase [Planctomycetota bacterium]
MTFDASVQSRLKNRLCEIYGQQGCDVLPRLLELMQHYRNLDAPPRATRWDQRDMVLITYGDQVREAGHTPLESLQRFVADYQLHELINIVHILPFCPSTSDDGFSVVDHKAVDPNLGSWSDIARIAARGELMFDLVLNHVSQASAWFQGYLAGDERYLDYFIEVDPDTDLSAVTRPRSSPLLTRCQTSRGPRHVWTTFSADQIDLNYANPAVLLEVLNTLLFYIQQGARIVRLDAVAYLWKEIGTSCIHLPRTHGIVKLMRDIVDILAPHVLLLTETNVPHVENISYLGSGDEAHMVYQFSLPPLLAEALLRHDATTFNAWLSSLDSAPPSTTYFNFTASHDGIGVRPLEGLVSETRRKQLVEIARARGGRVGTKRNPDGTDTPYELNVTYLDLLSHPECSDPGRYAARFLASQAIMLSLRGIPGIYFNSLVGACNDYEAVEASGIARRINRRKFKRSELDGWLADSRSLPGHVLEAYCRLLAVRVAQPAFHPEGGQDVFCAENKTLMAFLRTAPDASQRILVLANVADHPLQVELSDWDHLVPQQDLLTGTPIRERDVRLDPYQVMWLQVMRDGLADWRTRVLLV